MGTITKKWKIIGNHSIKMVSNSKIRDNKKLVKKYSNIKNNIRKYKLILGRRKNRIIKDQRKRVKYHIYEIIKRMNKWLFRYSKLSIKNKCILTGRSRAINRKFRISRIKVKDLTGVLPGLKKVQW